MQTLRDISPTILAILGSLAIGGGITGALAYALDGHAEVLAIGEPLGPDHLHGHISRLVLHDDPNGAEVALPTH